ncbi:MAG: DUF424 domain-containing protein [Thermoplasmatota archaeon]
MDESRDFYMKIHHYGGQLTLAACDREILGKKLKQGKVTVVINPGFYGGDLVEGSTVLDMLGKVSNANLFGNRIVELASNAGWVDPGGIMIIEDIKHVQIYDVREKG